MASSVSHVATLALPSPCPLSTPAASPVTPALIPYTLLPLLPPPPPPPLHTPVSPLLPRTAAPPLLPAASPPPPPSRGQTTLNRYRTTRFLSQGLVALFLP